MYEIWPGWALCHNHCRLFDAKYFSYIYIKYRGLGLVCLFVCLFVGWIFIAYQPVMSYFMPKPVHLYISNIYELLAHILKFNIF